MVSYQQQQQQQEKKNILNDDFDTTTPTTTTTVSSVFSVKRNVALLFYGGLYQGCGQELIYNNLFSTLFGVGRHPRIVFLKVFLDMFVIQPCVSLPLAYLIKAPIFGSTMKESIQKYLQDIQQRNLLKHCWLVWAPTQMISFTIIPTHLRISFMACISFFWIILFSSISSSSSPSSSSPSFALSSSSSSSTTTI